MNPKDRYVADISALPDLLIDRMPVQALVDGRLIVDAIDVHARIDGLQATLQEDLPSVMTGTGWSRDRALRALLGADVVRDVRRGGPSIEMLDRIDHAMALLGVHGDEEGLTCPIGVSESIVEAMIRTGNLPYLPED